MLFLNSAAENLKACTQLPLLVTGGNYPPGGRVKEGGNSSRESKTEAGLQCFAWDSAVNFSLEMAMIRERARKELWGG